MLVLIDFVTVSLVPDHWLAKDIEVVVFYVFFLVFSEILLLFSQDLLVRILLEYTVLALLLENDLVSGNFEVASTSLIL